MSNILIFGDSISQGYYDKEGGWAERLKRFYFREEIEQKWEQSINIFNLSISGDTTKEILERLEKETPPRIWDDHDIVFVFPIGTNDSILINHKQKTSQVQFEKNLITIIKKTRKYSDKIHFLGPLPVEEEKVTPMHWSPTESYYNSKIEEYNEIMRSITEQENIQFLDLYHEWIKKDYKKLLFDGVHPNTEGHNLLYLRMKEYINKFLL